MSFAKPVVELPSGKRLCILEVRSSYGEGGPIDECKYHIMGCEASAVWVSVASLRPIIQQGKILG
jgi:hypothetical protein